MEKFSYRMMVISLFMGSSLFSTVSAADQPQTSQPSNLVILSALAQISAAGVAAQYDKAEQFFIKGKEAGLSELQM